MNLPYKSTERGVATERLEFLLSSELSEAKLNI